MDEMWSKLVVAFGWQSPVGVGPVSCRYCQVMHAAVSANARVVWRLFGYTAVGLEVSARTRTI